MDLNAVKAENLSSSLSNYEVVFQTVPYEILNEELLSSQVKKPLIIELSSGCIGTNIEAAESHGFKVVDATNLPERYTPNTAGSIFYDITLKILKENHTAKGGL